jgi:hypothetical protein
MKIGEKDLKQEEGQKRFEASQSVKRLQLNRKLNDGALSFGWLAGRHRRHQHSYNFNTQHHRKFSTHPD